MTLDSLLTSAGATFLLYAETHYRFKGVYSRLRKPEPEIVADAPHRLDPAQSLPVLLLIKDADRYPTRLLDVVITIRSREGATWRHEVPLGDLPVPGPLWWRILEIDPPADGRLSVDAEIRYRVGDGLRSCRNDNYTGCSHEPLSVWVGRDPLPCDPGWVFGDLHTHSSYTSDQVEFGVPLAAAAKLAESMGLRFFAATDHSYDLDDHPQDYLRNHPGLPKWKAFWAEVDRLNQAEAGAVILPGEEISCGNAGGRNVHFLVLNSRRFFRGSGDSAERWLRTRPELSIADVLGGINDDALAIAAHPSAPPPFLEWLVVRRGHWEDADCRAPGLAGLQVWNGSEKGLREGLDQWVRCLLSGQRLYLYGGNDAHGNFNRFRQIGFPFFTMREHHEHLFGKVRTAVRINGSASVESILAALRAGRCVVSDGPFVTLEFEGRGGAITLVGGTAVGAEGRLRLRARSTTEFGSLRHLRLLRGVIGADREVLVQKFDHFENPYFLEATLPVESTDIEVYYRAEVESGDAADLHRGFTNPLWLG